MPKDFSIDDFAYNMRKLGVDITGYNPNDRLCLFNIAKLCAKQAGIPAGITVGIAMSGVGSVTLPVIGAIPGYVAGFLAGAFGGTASCTIGRMSLKRDLDSLLNDSSQSVKTRVINNF